MVFDDIDALFREARELVLGDDGDEAPDDELKRSATKLCPDDATENDATENVVLKNKNDARAATFTSLDANGAETKTTPKTPCVFNTTYARLGSRVSDTVITNERPPDDNCCRVVVHRRHERYQVQEAVSDARGAVRIAGRGAACRFGPPAARRAAATTRSARGAWSRGRSTGKPRRSATGSNGARKRTRDTQTRTNVDRDATERVLLNFFLKKCLSSIGFPQVSGDPHPAHVRIDEETSETQPRLLCVFDPIAYHSRPRARPGGPLSAPTLLCGALMGGIFPSFGTVVSQAVLIGALVGVSKRAGLISTHPQSLKNDAARSVFVSFVNTSEWAVAYVETLLAKAVAKK